MKAQVVTMLVLAVLVVGSGIGYFANNVAGHATTKTTVSTYTLILTKGIVPESSQTSSPTAFTTYFDFPVSVNYSGAWNLAYWGQNGTASQGYQVYCNACYGGTTRYNVYGSLSGSGEYQMDVTTYGLGYVENTLCVEAAILGAATGNLTLTVLGEAGTATSLNPTAEVCATLAV